MILGVFGALLAVEFSVFWQIWGKESFPRVSSTNIKFSYSKHRPVLRIFTSIIKIYCTTVHKSNKDKEPSARWVIWVALGFIFQIVVFKHRFHIIHELFILIFLLLELLQTFFMRFSYLLYIIGDPSQLRLLLFNQLHGLRTSCWRLTLWCDNWKTYKRIPEEDR